MKIAFRLLKSMFVGESYTNGRYLDSAYQNVLNNLETFTVVPVKNGHPRDQAKVSVPLITGTDGHVYMKRDIDNVAVHSRWPLTTGVAQCRYYCSSLHLATQLKRFAQATLSSGSLHISFEISDVRSLSSNHSPAGLPRDILPSAYP